MRYYQEFDDTEKTKPLEGHVLAVRWDNIAYGLLSSSGFIEKSLAADTEYRQYYCQEITEQEARSACPELFEYLQRHGLMA